MKQVLFQIHWALGITAGLLLCVIGITGATMVFEDEIMAALNRDRATLVHPGATPMTVVELARFVHAAHPQSQLSEFTVYGAADQAWLVVLGGKQQYIDPYDGRLLGPVTGERFFAVVRRIHQFMLVPGDGLGWGRLITRCTAFSLIFFALSGLYMRWPKQPLNWRSWFHLDLKKTGRNFYRSLHVTVGGWVFIVYLFSATTGLWWSFGENAPPSWYRNAWSELLTGHPFDGPSGGAGPALPDMGEDWIEDLDRAWTTFIKVTPGDFEVVNVRPDNVPGQPPWYMRFRSTPKDPIRLGSRNLQALDFTKVDGKTGKLLMQMVNRNMSTGQYFIYNMSPIHMGYWWGLPSRILFMVSALTLPVFTVTGMLLYLGRRRKKQELRVVQGGEQFTGDGSLLVIYASQTGTAERLARQTAMAFGAGRRPVDLVGIDRLDPNMLVKAKTALFVASTYGEGEPPDAARGFARRHLAVPLSLPALSYAVMALGDREYSSFGAFGRRIDEWLRAAGARPLFDVVSVDGAEPSHVNLWWRGIATLGALPGAVKHEEVVYERWRLVEREALNSGSPGAPAFHISFEPVEKLTHWEAGDIVEVLPEYPPQESLAVRREMSDEALEVAVAVEPVVATTASTTIRREYSIASIPPMGRIELIVRQLKKDDGSLGLGSGWLTTHMAIGQEIRLRIRTNPSFRAPQGSHAAILIGNGTGLAGLIAHIRQRAGQKAGSTWLLFGERSRRHDRFHADELDRHLAAGTIDKIDYAFSRDPHDGRYVQDLISANAEEIRRWVDAGAIIFVCGSLKGMAPSVDQRLREVLGGERLDALAESGRYRRDVY